MSCILALETATDACSAALWIDGAVSERSEIAPRRHVALILPFADSLLQEAGISPRQLDAVAFGRGPGSFTGLRIAAGMAQGIAFGADLPVLPVSTLAALAQAAVRLHQVSAVLAALDARMGEVYWGAYRCTADGLVVSDSEECVCVPQQTPVLGASDWHGAGDGWSSYAQQLLARHRLLPERIYPALRPQAADVVRLAAAAFSRGDGLPPEQAAPVYLRNHVADKPRNRA